MNYINKIYCEGGLTFDLWEAKNNEGQHFVLIYNDAYSYSYNYKCTFEFNDDVDPYIITLDCRSIAGVPIHGVSYKKPFKLTIKNSEDKIIYDYNVSWN